MPTIDQLLGYGIVRPFRRDLRNDFAATGGEALVRACVAQVLGTMCAGAGAYGELPWRTDFGSMLYRLRHRKNDDALQELARTYVVEALAKWEPRIAVSDFEITREEAVTGAGENVLRIRLRYDIRSQPRPGSAVSVKDIVQEIDL